MKIGDHVHIVGYEGVGEIIAIKGINAEVAMGILKMKVKLEQLTQADDDEWEENKVEETSYEGVDTMSKMQSFQFELDVRGKMRDELIPLLTTWADDAILIGANKAKIVHGRGNGVLRDTVRSFLKKYKEVEKLENEEGGWGDGVTLVTFRA